MLAAVPILVAAWLAVQNLKDAGSIEITNIEDSAKPATERSPIQRNTIKGDSRKPSVARAIAMSPRDWRNYLASHDPDLDPQLAEELIELAVELEESIAAGLSPQSVDAQVYGEAMLVLLESETPED